MHVALVALVDTTGHATGQHMFVRYCSGCQRGFPLHLFEDDHRMCKVCIQQQQRRNAAGRRAIGTIEDGGRQWATFDKPLLLDEATPSGLCKAKGCNAAAFRRGGAGNSARGNRELHALCDHHRQVCTPTVGRCDL